MSASGRFDGVCHLALQQSPNGGSQQLAEQSCDPLGDSSLSRRHLLFDIDGTLISAGGAGSCSLLSAVGEMAGVPQPHSPRFAGRTDSFLIAELLRLNGLTPTEEVVAEVRQRYLQELPLQLSRCDGRVLPGIAELLARLEREPRAAVGLLTGNSAEGAKLKLSHFGLWKYFDFGFFGDCHADRNALSRDAWSSLVARHTSLQPEHVIVIGDTPFDIRCAQTIGARSLACCTGGCSEEELRDAGATWVLDDLADVDQVMSLLLSE